MSERIALGWWREQDWSDPFPAPVRLFLMVWVGVLRYLSLMRARYNVRGTSFIAVRKERIEILSAWDEFGIEENCSRKPRRELSILVHILRKNGARGPGPIANSTGGVLQPRRC
jgi:hypothetical protein